MKRSLLTAALLFALAALLFALAAPADASEIEAGLVTVLFPGGIDDIGGNIGVPLGVVPQDWFVIGRLLGGHKVFLDAQWLADNTKALGGSASLRPAHDDNGWRAGAAFYKTDTDRGGYIYLRNSWVWGF